MDQEKRAEALLQKWRQNACSPAEFEEIVLWLHGLDESGWNLLEEPLKDLWLEAIHGRLDASPIAPDWETIYKKAIGAAKEKRQVFVRRLIRYAAAAAIAGLIAGSWFYFHKTTPSPQTLAGTIRQAKDIPPGASKATLTLSNGSTIILDSARTGELANQSGSAVLKLDSGMLAYHSSNPTSSIESYNILRTPRGGQYRLQLPDGSLVWLDAASSIRYPTSFTSSERIVELTGQAYFEIAKDHARPFHVRVEGEDIQVLGTAFNVMAYDDEPEIKTTLLQGAVKITAGFQTAALAPGKEASLDRNQNILSLRDGNIESAIAWKNGYFFLQNSDLPSILRQISRWYNIDIVYEARPAPDLIFSGEIKRSLPLSGIAYLLEHGRVHFRIEANKFIVMK